MDITPQDNTTQSISDDQELAKALAGVLPEEEAPAVPASGMQFEETPASSAAPIAAPVAATSPVDAAAVTPQALTTPVLDVSDTQNLDGIKNDALNELRPLIDRVDLPAEEKFDIYLMLIRSTDDGSLIRPAHAAAQNIADEKRKAEALLDIIKEIDYLARKDQQPQEA